MLKRVRQRYINNIKKAFLGLTDMKVIKSRIEKRGFETSRIYGHKNVKRLSAFDRDKNRIEFILSDKHLYILLSLSFSNRLVTDIIYLSTNKDNDFKDYAFGEGSAFTIFRTLFENDKNTLSPHDLHFTKPFMHKDSFKVKNMWAQNKIAIVRDFIISNELDYSLLPFFSKMRESSKESILKNVSDDIIKTLIVRDIKELHDLEMFNNKDFFNGYFLFKYVYGKYIFDEHELNTFFTQDIIPYIVKNRDSLVKKYSKNEMYVNNVKKISVEFFKDLIIDEEKEKNWFISANEELYNDSDDINDNFDFTFNEDKLLSEHNNRILKRGVYT